MPTKNPQYPHKPLSTVHDPVDSQEPPIHPPVMGQDADGVEHDDQNKPVAAAPKRKSGRRWSKEGTVKYVESAKVVLDDGDGADWPCYVRGDANVTINGVKAHRADINNGDKVRIAGGSQDVHTVEVARDGWEYPADE